MRAVPRWQLAWEQTCHTYDSVSFGGGGLMQKQIEALKQLCLKAGIRDADIAACSAARELLLRFITPDGITNFKENTGNESLPIQLAQCRFPGLAISNAKI